MWPSNDTQLSLAGILKWLAILVGCFSLWSGVNDLLGRTDLEAGKAHAQGLGELGWSVAGFATAFALWFFWQRNEE